MATKAQQEKLNELADRFKQTKTAMEKAGATEEQIQRLYDARKDHEIKIKSNGDDLAKLNAGKKLSIQGGTTLGELPQKGLPDMSKVVGLGKENMWRKKLSKVGKGGVAGLALALGSSMLPEDSYAATAAETAGRVIDEGSPSSFLTPGSVGEGSDEVTPEMRAEMQAEQEKRKAQMDALRSLPQQDYVTQRQAPEMTGQNPEQESQLPEPIGSNPEAGRFSRLFKDKGTYR